MNSNHQYFITVNISTYKAVILIIIHEISQLNNGGPRSLHPLCTYSTANVLSSANVHNNKWVQIPAGPDFFWTCVSLFILSYIHPNNLYNLTITTKIRLIAINTWLSCVYCTKKTAEDINCGSLRVDKVSSPSWLCVYV